MKVTFKPDAQAQKLINEFESGKEVGKLVYINGKDQTRPARVHVEFESLGDIIATEYNHSVFLKFTNPEDLDLFIEIEQEAANSLSKDIEFKSMLKEDKLFLKLPVKDGKFAFNIDPAVSPSALEKSPLHSGSLLDIELQPNVWINFDKRQAGLFLKIQSMTIDGGKRKILRKR
jgi:hypothetical protein